MEKGKKNQNMEIEDNSQFYIKINPNNENIPMEEEIEDNKPNKKDFKSNSIKFKTTKSSTELNTSTATNYSNNLKSIDQSINSNNDNNKLVLYHPIFKIDNSKSNYNYLYDLEYFDEIYMNLLLDENNTKLCINKEYMKNQKDINISMREILVDWLIEVHYHLNFKRKTLYQTILIIDLYLSQTKVQKVKLQLLGIASLLISCKENEICYPKLEQFINLTNNSYMKKDLLKMEIQILKTLNFDILSPTTEEFYNILSKVFNFDKIQNFFGEYFMDSSLIDYEILKYKPSVIAAACAYVVMKFYKIDRYKELYSYKIIMENSPERVIKNCARELCFFVKNLSKSSLQTTRIKYSLEEYGNVTEQCENK